MKRATVAAAAVAIVAAIAGVAVRWGGGGVGAGRAESRAAPESEDRRAPSGTANGASATHPSDPESAPAPAGAAPEGARVPEPAGAGELSLDFDLRGPDDEPLARGVVFIEGERSNPNTPAPRVVQRAWRRESPRLALPAWTAWIHAEADSIDDELVNFDLASVPVELDRAAAAGRDGAPQVVRLHPRPGVFGRVRGPIETTPCSVVCRMRRPGDAAPIDPEDVNYAWGWLAPVMRRADGIASYSIVDREPGTYLVALSDDHVALSPVVEVAASERMVRVDLEIDPDAAPALRVRVVGLPDDERDGLEFEWIDGASPHGAWCETRRFLAADGAYRVAPTQQEPRKTLRRLLAGELAPDEHCMLALLRHGEVAAAQPLANGQRDATFTLGADANLTVRLDLGGERTARRRLDLVPAGALALLSGPSAAQDGDDAGGATLTRTFRQRAPGDFVLQVWAPLASALHHGEVWWPIERRAVTLRAGDQELELEAPALHPLTVRFDRARFGADAKVQLMRRDFAKWPRYAAPDERGVARFDDVPAGDYTVAVIGDAAGQADCTIPGTSDLTVEPTRREH